MTENEAIKILHPDTTRKTLAEIEYYAGFKGYEAQRKAVDEACVIACVALEEIQLYRAIGTVEECREAVEKMKGQALENMKGESK